MAAHEQSCSWKGGRYVTKTIRKITPLVVPLPQRVKVAGYARVSSDKEAMLHSLAAQVSYYSEIDDPKPA